jgi:hypothetical protein
VKEKRKQGLASEAGPLPPAHSPPHLHKPDDPRVFVFGSNRLGVHGAGAARYAARSLGAKSRVGEGLTGRSYALPTCSVPGVPVTLDELRLHVARFIDFAQANPNERFFVSELGCGIAGFKPEQVAPMFSEAPSNCDLPPGWRQPRRVKRGRPRR